MSRCETSETAARSRSPLGTALLISFAVAAGAVASTLDAAIFDEITSGRWLTRPFADAQERNTTAIASLQQSVGAIGRDIDFVAGRAGAAIRHNEDLARDRFAQIDARIAELRERFGTEQARVAPAPVADASHDVTGLRASLNDLAAAHTGAVAAIRRRLDRIEVAVGISTDMLSSASDPAARRATRRHAARRSAAPAAVPQAEPVAAQSAARPERGHLFNVKPLSQQGAPLRLSRLPG